MTILNFTIKLIELIILIIFIKYFFKFFNKKKNLLLITDPNNNLNNNFIIQLLINYQKNYNIYILCAPGITVDKSPHNESMKKIRYLQEIFPQFKTRGWTNLFGSNFYVIPPYYITRLFKLDYLIITSSLANIETKSLCHLNINQCIFLGDRKQPELSDICLKNINKNNELLRLQFYDQQELLNLICNDIIEITEDFANSVSIHYTYLTNMPPNILEPFLKKYWLYLTNIPEPNEISSITDTKILAKRCLSILPESIIENLLNKNDINLIPTTVNYNTFKLAKNYAEIIKKNTNEFIDFDYIKDIQNILKVIYLISNGCEYNQNNLLKSKNLNNCEEGYLSYKNFIAQNNSFVSLLTLSYDMVAWNILNQKRF